MPQAGDVCPTRMFVKACAAANVSLGHAKGGVSFPRAAPRRCDRHLMKSLQVGRDPAGSEVIVLAEIDDLADDVVLPSRGTRRGVRGRSHNPASPCSPNRRRHLSNDLREMPNRRHVRATLPVAAACCNIFDRQVVTRSCSVFVIASPLQQPVVKRRRRT